MLPLEGLTVIAVEQAVAAPFCSSRLADAGAHVIKVERPEGDFARGYDAAAKGQSSYFVWLNRGKDSVVIDLATKEGRKELEQLQTCCCRISNRARWTSSVSRWSGCARITRHWSAAPSRVTAMTVLTRIGRPMIS